MHVTVRKGDVNGAIRVLKKKLMREGFFQELRRRESFMSKGEKERKAKALLVDEGGSVNKRNLRQREDIKMPRRKMTTEQKEIFCRTIATCKGKKVA